ncbi:MAG: class I SAM-dependent methyltransferase [Pseudolabrys sp.]
MNAETSIQNDDGAWKITTPPQAWSYAAGCRLERKDSEEGSSIGIVIKAEVEVLTGEIGLALVGSDPTRFEQELLIKADGARTVSLKGSEQCTHLLVRTGQAGPATMRIKNISAWTQRSYDITSDFAAVLPTLIVSPGEQAAATVADALSHRHGRVISPNELGHLTCGASPSLCPTDIFNDEVGKFLCGNYTDQINLLSTYDINKWPKPGARPSREAVSKYFRQTIIRVYQLVTLLRRLGLTTGSVLDVGSAFGYFARPLQLLGYQVTAVDRYQDSNGGYYAYLDRLRSIGVRVVETSQRNELDILGQLGEFDAVISMAVIEHVPHTPREFLRMLVSHVRPGGILAVDTPNIARYWNRKRFAEGRSVHQPIDIQFHADIPYTGHHREYTADEVMWMLTQVGCRDIALKLFDYNVLQFEELSSDHVEALLTMALDDTLCDTILAAGYCD